MRTQVTTVLFTVIALPLAAASIQAAKPEDVGLSSERLQRIHQTIQRHIDGRDITGAVTLVARKGRIAHFRRARPHGPGIEKGDAQGRPLLDRFDVQARHWCRHSHAPEEGKVRLNDPVSKFLPEFKGMKVAVIQDRPAGSTSSAPPAFYTVPATREITIQDLLTHVSGLASGGAASGAELAKVARKPGEKLADYIPRLASTPLDFQPGSQWRYSPGAAFDTLGRIVEIISDQSFDQFLRQRIFEPLGNDRHLLSSRRGPLAAGGNHLPSRGRCAALSGHAGSTRQHDIFFRRGRVDDGRRRLSRSSARCCSMAAS